MRVPIPNWMPLLAAAVVTFCGCAAPSQGRWARESDRSGTESPSGSTDSQSAIPVNAVAHFATALSYDLEGRQIEALDHYSQAANQDPSYEPVVIETARRHLRAGEPDKAIPLLERSASRKDASGTLFAWLGLAYAQANHPDKAIKADKKAIRLLPDSLGAYQNLSHLYLQNGRTNDAVAVLDQAARRTSVDAEFLLDLADLNDRYGQSRLMPPQVVRQRITKLLDRVLEQDPEHPVILQRVGDGYLKAGAPEKAETAFVRLLERFPRMLLIRSKLADIYLQTGNTQKAMEQLQELSAQNPTNARTQAFLGMLALDSNDVTNAVSYLERALILEPGLENVYYDLARAHLMARQPDLSQEVLNRARARFHSTFMLELYSGMTAAVQEKYNDAVRHFLSAELIAQAGTSGGVQLNPQFFFQVGSAYERNGDHEQAAEYFQKALVMSPDFAEALNYLGYMWADLGIQLEQARELIEKALKQQPENPAYLDSLAWVLFKLKQPTDALPPMLKAIEKSEEPDPVLFDHLGDIQHLIGNHAAAKQAWESSLKAQEDTKVRRKLDSLTPVETTNP